MSAAGALRQADIGSHILTIMVTELALADMRASLGDAHIRRFADARLRAGGFSADLTHHARAFMAAALATIAMPLPTRPSGCGSKCSVFPVDRATS